MKKFLLAIVCVGFASASVFAGDCCDKKKDGEKKDATKSNLTVQF